MVFRRVSTTHRRRAEKEKRSGIIEKTATFVLQSQHGLWTIWNHAFMHSAHTEHSPETDLSPDNQTQYRLTQYSHGAGCGCKIAPAVLDEILRSNETFPLDVPQLLVGNHSRDDAAVYDLGTGQALISTTDFFMPIVDDPFAFGRIASANAISDVYAMGGSPVLAVAILGWTVEKLPTSIARRVIEGSRSLCAEAGIPLAGGHSIDSPEPIFGLAVNGLVDTDHLKRNNTAQAGDVLLLTKPLGVGILTTAEKRGILLPEDEHRAAEQMMKLNRVGTALGKCAAVHAMTDVTGFGLLGHLTEMASGSGLQAELWFDTIPTLPNIQHYIAHNAIPGGTQRNWNSYGHGISPLTPEQRAILCDPQTSGGLLIAVEEQRLTECQAILRDAGLEAFVQPIGTLTSINITVTDTPLIRVV